MLHEFSPFQCKTMHKPFGSGGLNHDVVPPHIKEKEARKRDQGKCSAKIDISIAGREHTKRLPLGWQQVLKF